MGTINYVDLDDAGIDTFQKKQLENAVEKHLGKLEHFVKNEFTVTLHTKAYNQTGERRKFSVHLKLNFPGSTMTAEKDDWDFLVAVKHAFAALEQQLMSRFKL